MRPPEKAKSASSARLSRSHQIQDSQMDGCASVSMGSYLTRSTFNSPCRDARMMIARRTRRRKHDAVGLNHGVVCPGVVFARVPAKSNANCIRRIPSVRQLMNRLTQTTHPVSTVNSRDMTNGRVCPRSRSLRSSTETLVRSGCSEWHCLCSVAQSDRSAQGRLGPQLRFFRWACQSHAGA